jgi:hypothetical protein
MPFIGNPQSVSGIVSTIMNEVGLFLSTLSTSRYETSKINTTRESKEVVTNSSYVASIRVVELNLKQVSYVLVDNYEVLYLSVLCGIVKVANTEILYVVLYDSRKA